MTKALLLSTAVSLSLAFILSPAHSAERQAQPGFRDSCQSNARAGDKGQAALAKAFIAKLAAKPNERVAIDFTQPDMEAGYRAVLAINGMTPERNARRFARIDQVKAFQAKNKANGQARKPVSEISKPKNGIAPLGIFGDSWGNVQAAGFTSVYNPSELFSVQNDPEIHLVSQDCNILAFGSSEREGWDAKSALVVTKNAVNRPSSYQGPMQVITILFGTDDENNPIAEAQATPLMTDLVDSADWNDPVYKHGQTSGPVIVCLNRANPDVNAPDQCDYGPLQPNVSNEEAHLLLVATGAVNTKDPIMLGNDGRPINPGGDPVRAPVFTLSGTETGGTCEKRYVKGDFWSNVTFMNGNKTMAWKFPETGDINSLADFGELCWKNNSDYIVNLMITLYTQKSPNDPAQAVYVTFTNATQYGANKPQMGSVVDVAPIQMQYGCILAGTPITMADGSQKIVDDVRPGDLLRSRNGSTLRVRSRLIGTDAKFVGLIDEKGNRVVVTEGHPLPTGRGIIKASDIAVGDMIEAEGGPVKVTQVDLQTRNEVAQVYSLNTESADGSPLTNTADGVFYAGNVLVGDQKLQQQVQRNKVAQQ